MSLDNLKDGLTGAIDKAQAIFGSSPAAALGGAVIGSVGAGTIIASAVAIKKSRSKKAKKSRKKNKSRRKGRKLKFGSKAYRKKYLHKHRSSAGGRLRRHRHRSRPSGKGIHYTKNGQPYIILSSGKARFVSKRGARASRKRKGGRY